jgi:hypothetical protein
LFRSARLTLTLLACRYAMVISTQTLAKTRGIHGPLMSPRTCSDVEGVWRIKSALDGSLVGQAIAKEIRKTLDPLPYRGRGRRGIRASPLAPQSCLGEPPPKIPPSQPPKLKFVPARLYFPSGAPRPCPVHRGASGGADLRRKASGPQMSVRLVRLKRIYNF